MDGGGEGGGGGGGGGGGDAGTRIRALIGGRGSVQEMRGRVWALSRRERDGQPAG